MTLPDFSNLRIAVVGDAMRDVYVHGRIDRISPEAPVPVFVEERRETRPGGAANVAACVQALGAQCALIAKHDSQWPIKTRHIAQGYQVFRVDNEDTKEISQAEIDADAKALAEFKPDLVIVSDYAKGTITPQMMVMVRATGVRFLVDPKRADWSIYAGALCITPNEREFNGASHQWDVTNAILVTQGAVGMTLLKRDYSELDIPAIHHEVVDVTGAGDAVIATLGCCLAANIDLPEAARIANVAAGLVCLKRGTATCSRAELEAAL